MAWRRATGPRSCCTACGVAADVARARLCQFGAGRAALNGRSKSRLVPISARGSAAKANGNQHRLIFCVWAVVWRPMDGMYPPVWGDRKMIHFANVTIVMGDVAIKAPPTSDIFPILTV